MIRFFRELFSCFVSKEAVHFTPCSNSELEFSNGDRAALYGWPDKTVEEVQL